MQDSTTPTKGRKIKMPAALAATGAAVTKIASDIQAQKDRFAPRFLDADTLPVETDFSVTMDGVGFCKPGQFGVILSEPSMGKSQTIQAMVTAYLAAFYGIPLTDLIDIECPPQNALNGKPRRIGVVDCERDEEDMFSGFEQVYRRLKLTNPRWRKKLMDGGFDFDRGKDIADSDILTDKGNIPMLAWADLREPASDPTPYAGMTALEKLCESECDLDEEGNPILDTSFGLLIIDGFLEFVRDVNDMTESKVLASRIRNLANRHRMTIVLTLHPKSGNKESFNGNLGQALHRLARGVVLIRRNKEMEGVREITTKFEDGKLSKSNRPISIFMKWDDEKFYMVPHVVDNIAKVTGRDAEVREAFYDTLYKAKALQHVYYLPHNELKSEVMKRLTIGSTSFDKYLKMFKDNSTLLYKKEGKSICYGWNYEREEPTMYN